MRFDEYHTLFLHIGKTAGVAVEHWLREALRDANITDRESLYGYDRRRGVYLQHASAALTRELVGEQVFEDYFTFAVVRNPFSRLVSVYYYLFDQHQERFGSFENYILALPQLLDTDQKRLGSHHIPQVHYTHINEEPCCDHIAFFELLPDSLMPVISLLGIDRPLPRLNVNTRHTKPKQPLSSVYTPEMIRVVTTLYADDFSTYGYRHDPDQLAPLDDAIPRQHLRQISSEKRARVAAIAQQHHAVEQADLKPGASISTSMALRLIAELLAKVLPELPRALAYKFKLTRTAPQLVSIDNPAQVWSVGQAIRVMASLLAQFLLQPFRWLRRVLSS